MSAREYKRFNFDRLPKAFRFLPSDELLINFYLRHKINGHHSAVDIIPEVDICKWEPWELPGLSVIKSDDPEWFFFSPRDKKYPNGCRSNRATEAGYWKATGNYRSIKPYKPSSSSCTNSQIVGKKKTLVFYKGRAPKGERTNWIMHEYRANEPDLDGTASGQGDYVICRLFHKADETMSLPSCSTAKSTPDDISPDVLQDKQIVKEPEDINEWQTPAFIENCASDGVDISAEETVMEESLPLRDLPIDEEATYNQIDGKIFGGLNPYSYSDFGAWPDSLFATDFGACPGSPFSVDFGSNERNEIHFRDGTSEPDASFSDALQGLHDQGLYDPRCTEGPGNFQDFDNAAEQDGSWVEPVETFYHPDQIEDVGKTGGIKIRSRHPPDGTSINSTTQGSAPRRMHLAMGYAPHSIDCHTPLTPQATDRTISHELEAAEANDDRTISHELEAAEENDERANPNGSPNGSPLVLRSGALADVRGSGFQKLYAMSIHIAIILSLVFLGSWIHPQLSW